MRVFCNKVSPFCYFHYGNVLRWLKLERDATYENASDHIRIKFRHKYLHPEGVRELLKKKYPTKCEWNDWFQKQVDMFQLEMQKKLVCVTFTKDSSSSTSE